MTMIRYYSFSSIQMFIYTMRTIFSNTYKLVVFQHFANSL